MSLRCWKVRAKDAGGFARSLNANWAWSGSVPDYLPRYVPRYLVEYPGT